MLLYKANKRLTALYYLPVVAIEEAQVEVLEGLDVRAVFYMSGKFGHIRFTRNTYAISKDQAYLFRSKDFYRFSSRGSYKTEIGTLTRFDSNGFDK
ncbi:hypothetical protein AgCh_025163 [Apium graveolens]